MKHPVLIKNLIQKIIKTYHLEKPLQQQKSVEIWADTVGNDISSKTKAVSYKDGNLFVEVETSTLRNELRFKKEEIKDSLNSRIGKNVVENIVLINRRQYGGKV